MKKMNIKVGDLVSTTSACNRLWAPRAPIVRAKVVHIEELFDDETPEENGQFVYVGNEDGSRTGLDYTQFKKVK